MHRVSWLVVVWFLGLVLVILVAYGELPATPNTLNEVALGTPTGYNDEATLGAALTQAQDNANTQAVASAASVRADAQATLDSKHDPRKQTVFPR